ncbi:MAG: hypothetical protein HZA78_06800 [Candidatus Schekmanbacteria bacterium]|nr:hypothetical protein [Candidatus Schekmanbacteria bacterium]
MKKIFTILALLLLLPGSALSQNSPDPTMRGLTPREWKPRGQIRGDYNRVQSKLRELRIQEERRPRDIPAPAQSMGAPESARPVLYNLNYGRERLNTAIFGSGGVGIPFYSAGFGVSDYDLEDPYINIKTQEEPTTEWWEMNERSRSQRGGWFRTRFGTRQPMQLMQQGGGGNQLGPPGGVDTSGGITPGQNMPPGGGVPDGASGGEPGGGGDMMR